MASGSTGFRFSATSLSVVGAHLQRYAVFYLSLCCLAFSLAVYYPGYMSVDSIMQLKGARQGILGDANPPMMSYLWRVLDMAMPGPAPMLILHLALIWFSLATIAWLATSSNVLRIVIVLVSGFLPATFSQIGVIWKDVGMYAFFLTALALALLAQRQGALSLLLLSTAFLWLGSSYRHNALPAAAPLIIVNALIALPLVKARVAGGRGRWLFRFGDRAAVAAWTALICLLFLVTIQFVDRFHRIHVSLWRTTLIHDLVGMSVDRGTNLLPADTRPGQLDIRALKGMYVASHGESLLNPAVRGLLGASDTSSTTAIDSSQITDDRLISVWEKAILRYPLSYLRHRALFSAGLLVMDTSQTIGRLHVGIVSNEFHIEFPHSPLNTWVTSEIYSLQSTYLFAAWVYYLILIAVLFLPWFISFRFGTFVQLIAASGLINSLTFMAMASASDFRFNMWAIGASCVCCALLMAGKGQPEPRQNPDDKGHREWSVGPILAVLAVIPISTLWMIIRLYDNVPWGDQITLFAANKLDEGLTLAKLFAFHNEHQMVFTKLAVYIDYVWFHGSNVLPYFVNGLLLFGVWAVYCVALRRACTELSERSKRQLLVECGLLLVLYFNGRELWTITYPLMEHPWTCFLAVLGFYSFSRLVFTSAEQNLPENKRTHLAALIAALALAPLTSAGGLLAGPAMVIVVLVLLLRSRCWSAWVIRLGAIILGLSVVLIAGYGYAYVTQHVGGKPLAFNPLAIVRFVYLFVGGVFFRDSDWPAPHHTNLLVLYVVSTVFWALLVWLGAQLFRRRDRLTPFELFHWCVIVFVVLNAASGSVVRAALSDLEAINKKYASVGLLAWMSAASLLFHYRSGWVFVNRPRGWVRPLAISCGMVLLLLPGDVVEFHVWRAWQAQTRQTAVAVASDVYSSDLLRRLYYDGAVGYQTCQKFVRQGTYCYRRMPSPGYNLREHYRAAAPLGYDLTVKDTTVMEEAPGREGFVASGTTQSADSEFPALLITDDHDRVEGYGLIARVSLQDGSSLPSGEWFAAFRKPPESTPPSTFRIYEIQRGYARLAGTIFPSPPPVIDSRTRATSIEVPRIADHTDYCIDVFSGIAVPLLHQPVYVPIAGTITLAGWAVDRDQGKVPAAVDMVIDGDPWPASIGRQRDDVASYFHQPGFAKSGFSFSLPAAKVGSGTHQLVVRIYTTEAKYFLNSTTYAFVVR